MPSNFIREDWAGKKFICNETGSMLIIPEDVRPKDFYSFGNCFIDVGDGYYSRAGGDFYEVFEDEEE